MILLFLSLLAVAAVGGALVVARPSERGERATVALRFGTGLSVESAEAVIASISGLSARSRVIFETFADEAGIRHSLSGEQGTLDVLCGQLRGLIPDLRIEPGYVHPQLAWTRAARIRWSGRHVLLQRERIEHAAARVLATFGNLAPGEAMLARVTVRPGRRVPVAVRRQEQPGLPSLLELLSGRDPLTPEHGRAVEAKQDGPLVSTCLSVAVAAGHQKRAAHLIARLASAYRARRGALGQLHLEPLRADRFAGGHEPQWWWRGDLLSPAELAGLFGWPIGELRLPGLSLGASPLLMPDRRIRVQGLPIGASTWPGLEHRPLSQSVTGALSHTLVAGPSGSGKSALLANLVLAHVREGRGCLVVDGKGDLVEDLLARIPQERLDDVVVLDPAAAGPVPGLRVFGRGRDPELTADLVLGVLRDLFADSWGVRTEQWLRVGLVTLAHDPQATLGDLPYLFSDELYRRRLVGRLRDPLMLASWASYEAMKPAERANQLGAPLNKLNQLLGRRVLRTILSQQRPSLDLTEAIRRGRIVIVSLSPGRIGSPAARLLGALVMYQLLVAVQARASVSPTRRLPFFAFVDEPRVLGDIPVPLDSLFELARGLGVGVTLAAQSLSQLSTPVRTAALTNAATLVAFRQNHDDAALLANQLPGCDAGGLEQLGPFEIIARIGLGPGDVAAPASGRTLPLPPPIADPDVVRQASAARYGADPALVDQQLADRHQPIDTSPADESDGEIGRRRRIP